MKLLLDGVMVLLLLLISFFIFLFVFLYASGATTVKAPANKAKGIDKNIDLYNKRSTVSAVSIHAVSVVTKIIRLVFNIVVRLGCLCSCGIFLIPLIKFLKEVF